MFFSLSKKKKKNTLFMETATYSMIVVLFILRKGVAMIGVLKNRKQLSLTECS